MKICLIAPRTEFVSQNSNLAEYNKAVFSRENLVGLGTALPLIAALTPPDIEVEIVDENIQEIDYTKHYDLVGITAMTNQIIQAYEIAGQFRRNGVKVIIGGIHTTILPSEAQEHADSIAIGEGEYLWSQVIADLRNGALQPVYRSPAVVDLKDSPVPRYELLDFNKYNILWVETSRGCAHDCEFCASSKVYSRKYRRKPNGQILAELRHLKEKYGKIRIGFSDDNLFVDKKASKELLEQMIPLNLKWVAQCDISIGDDEELLDLARKSGCEILTIGFETVNQESLKNMDQENWKYKQFGKYAEYAGKIQSYGICIHGSFILGLDSDDLSIFQKTGDFVIDNHLASANFFILTPFPGTRLRERLEKENRLLPLTWEHYSKNNINFVPKNMTVEQLENGMIELFKRVTAKEVMIGNMKYFRDIFARLEND